MTHVPFFAPAHPHNDLVSMWYWVTLDGVGIWADAPVVDMVDLSADGTLESGPGETWHGDFMSYTGTRGDFSGSIVDEAVALLFRKMVEACQYLRHDCDSWQEAAEKACENHGLSDVPFLAYDILVDCASADLNLRDPGFWAGEFCDALEGAA